MSHFTATDSRPPQKKGEYFGRYSFGSAAMPRPQCSGSIMVPASDRSEHAQKNIITKFTSRFHDLCGGSTIANTSTMETRRPYPRPWLQEPLHEALTLQ